MAHRPAPDDVYTADELARAAGVPRAAVHALVGTGELRTVSGTGLFTTQGALDAVPRLRAETAARRPPVSPTIFARSAAAPDGPRPPNRVPLIASSCAHALLFACAFWLASGERGRAAVPPVADARTRLVYLVAPGPGGGGGGSGARDRRPVPRLTRTGATGPRPSTPPAAPRPAEPARESEQAPPPAAPAPVERAPEPLPAPPVIAPVVVIARDTSARSGVPGAPVDTAKSAGLGAGGQPGTGNGSGSGAGIGRGIGGGSDGGTGGGPHRAGSGIAPPRLVREVKADYPEDARRRGLSGEVVLEIVVARDGTVGDVTVLRGLGGGLDERAVAAVRQWQFAPATRLGAAVDVVVEVSVEFTLR